MSAIQVPAGTVENACIRMRLTSRLKLPVAQVEILNYRQILFLKSRRKWDHTADPARGSKVRVSRAGSLQWRLDLAH